jgi:hypothetical protein
MTLKAIFGRRFVRALGLAGVAATGYVFGITTDRLTAQQPGSPAPDRRVVAYIYDSIPVTREELGDFLIARGGYEKLDLLVNKKIIEVEAHRRGVTVTPQEVEAGLNEDLRGMGISLGDFTKHVLPRYNETLYEWNEDVVKPRILLGKMCRDRVKVSEEDLTKVFENKYGERRQAKVICWNREDLRAAQKQWDEARKGDVEFDRIARTQADPNLASAAGQIAPVGKYPEVEDDKCTQVLFSLKEGEISQLFETKAGIMCIKYTARIPADPNAKLEGELRKNLEKEVFDRKMTAEIPKFFNECKQVAKPNLLLKGPPSAAEIRDQVLQTSGITPPTEPMPPAPAATQNPPPMPKK